jgi:hypothetical protein
MATGTTTITVTRPIGGAAPDALERTLKVLKQPRRIWRGFVFSPPDTGRAGTMPVWITAN